MTEDQREKRARIVNKTLIAVGAGGAAALIGAVLMCFAAFIFVLVGIYLDGKKSDSVRLQEAHDAARREHGRAQQFIEQKLQDLGLWDNRRPRPRFSQLGPWIETTGHPSVYKSEGTGCRYYGEGVYECWGEVSYENGAEETIRSKWHTVYGRGDFVYHYYRITTPLGDIGEGDYQRALMSGD